jgi:hypothetical protein
MASYRDYEIDPPDNQQGSASATRFPEGWAGKFVNDALAHMGSAMRALGDATLFAPINDSDNVISQQAGTLALQDATAVDFAGGILATTVRGSVPVRTLVPWYGTLAQLNTELPSLLLGGWVPCDGRTVINPHTLANYTSPNLLGRLVGFATALGSSPSLTGAASKTSASGGTHNHSGTANSGGSHTHTGSTASAGSHTHTGTTGGENNNAFLLVSTTAGGSGLTTSGHTHSFTSSSSGSHDHDFTTASGGSHTHDLTIASGGSHTHSVEMDPLAARVIPLIRAW